MSMTGSSTPLSSSSTLTDASQTETRKFLSGAVLDPSLFPSADITASADAIIECLSSKSSSKVYAYDSALQYGFGALTKEWSRTGAGARCIEMQSRTGAGILLAAQLSQGTSTQGPPGTITAYTSLKGLGLMACGLPNFPQPSKSARIIIQVPALSNAGSSLELIPSLGHISAVATTLPADFTLVFSSTPAEAVDLSSIAFHTTDKHVIHVFDHFSSREIRRLSPPTRPDGPQAFEDAMVASGYEHFDYDGSPDARQVIVCLNGAVSKSISTAIRGSPDVGLITVRTLRPWRENALVKLLPKSVYCVHVLEEVSPGGGSSILLEDVRSALLLEKTSVYGLSLSSEQLANWIKTRSLIKLDLETLLDVSLSPPQPQPTLKRLVFLGSPSSGLTRVPFAIAQPFMSTPSITARLLMDYDGTSKAGGISLGRVILANDGIQEAEQPMNVVASITDPEGCAEFLAVSDASIIKTHNILSYASTEAIVLLLTRWTSEEALSNFPNPSISLARERQLSIYTFDVKTLSGDLVDPSRDASDEVEIALTHLAFLRLYLGVSCTESRLEKAARGLFGDDVQGVSTSKLVASVWPNIHQIDLPQVDIEEDPVVVPLKDVELNALNPKQFSSVAAGEMSRGEVGTWVDAAKNLIFREAFTPWSHNELTPLEQRPDLRPDLEDRTFLVTCTVNRRLTPLSYDRNVFHLEFDTTGTGLKYEIGEALGIHGWNDEQDVSKFCSIYGLDPAAIVSIPLPASGRVSGGMHYRTIFQALQQQIDIFGRPPKSFYTALADHATSRDHRMALRFIGAAEGSATFKKFAEVDTVTFADVLQMYSSARPDFATLCILVGDIKPRHYSIASAQSAVGDRVDLLVVTVDWITPSGSPRFGQCTRYLAGLAVGQQVTVSIKPSVMKLPPDNLQPIIMAGLGTGAAPFRAFIQHRAFLASQNIPIGPLVYYFGSRHRSEEYLYGEELEAYIGAGIITHAGFAFSRDQKKKIYIQHKMLEDGEMLARVLGGRGDAEASRRGVFYLCGPTWPVPDVYEALIGALNEYAGFQREKAAEHIEDLKEEERYVLEVY